MSGRRGRYRVVWLPVELKCDKGFAFGEEQYRYFQAPYRDPIVPPSPTAADWASPPLTALPVAEIIGVREAKVFKTSVRGGRSHLIVKLPSGEVAFYVASNADWINAITALIRPPG